MEQTISSQGNSTITKLNLPKNTLLDSMLRKGLGVTSRISNRLSRLNSAYGAITNLSVLLKDGGTLRFRNGFEFNFCKLSKKTALYLADLAVTYGVEFTEEKADTMEWVVDQDNGIVEVPQGIKFTLDSLHPLIFAETFLHQIHFPTVNLKGKEVVQAGGFIGDTALYYSNLGAKVVSMEPSIGNFELFKRNIELNSNLSDNITAANYAMGKDELIEFADSFGGNHSSNVKSGSTSLVKSVSLSTVLEEFNLKDPYLLDLDIKGNEQAVLQEKEVSKFHIVRVEYSTYGPRDGSTADSIIRKVKSHGFQNVQVLKHNAGLYSLDEHGTVVGLK